MDFIEGLPKVGSKSIILTVVDRFSKYARFIALGHPYIAMSVARAFFDGIVHLHGFLASIVNDRDPVFTGHVWRDLFRMVGVKLHFSTAFHPQTDGQSEVVNKVIAMLTRVKSINVLNEGLRIGEIGHRMNSKVKLVKTGEYRK
jgi:hypothetical protein